MSARDRGGFSVRIFLLGGDPRLSLAMTFGERRAVGHDAL